MEIVSDFSKLDHNEYQTKCQEREVLTSEKSGRTEDEGRGTQVNKCRNNQPDSYCGWKVGSWQ